MPPIVTVTLNPAIDETITLGHLAPGQVNRAQAASFQPGGKGINVASCLADWFDVPITVTGFLGAGNAAVFDALFARKRLIDRFRRLPGETRTNIKLLHNGETTEINLPGLSVGFEDVAGFRAVPPELAPPGAILLLAGSLPEGAPADLYAELIATMAPLGHKIILDTSGPPLGAALAGPAPPYAIKPNRAELEEVVGASLGDAASIVEAARKLIARGIALVTVSMGAEGAIFVTAEQACHAAAAVVTGRNTVGAGDAMVAGMIAALAESAPLEPIARLATAFAVAKLGETGPNLPARTAVEAQAKLVKITSI
jgi:1-phosphofructokinase